MASRWHGWGSWAWLILVALVVVLVVHSAPLLRSRLWLLRPPLPERLEMKPPSFTPATRNTKRASSR